MLSQVRSDLVKQLGGSIQRDTIEQSFLENGLGLALDLFLPPIHRLPPELLSHIFQFDDLASTTFPTQFAWKVAHVCSHWRQIAFMTPNLWSAFILDMSSFSSNATKLDDMLEFLDTCLTLSKTAPLRFAIMMRSRKVNACNAVLSRICPHSHRWRRAFFVASTDVLAPWKHLLQGNTPMLERFGIGSLDGETGAANLPHLFSNSTFSSLALYHYQIDDPLASSASPWRQITSLHLIACAYSTFPIILNQLPYLKELEIEGTPPRAGVAYLGHPIDLPDLTTLRITGYLHHICNLLCFLRTPSLANLSMMLYTSHFESRVQDDTWFVRDFIARSKVKKPVVQYVDECYLDSIQDHVIQFLQ